MSSAPHTRSPWTQQELNQRREHTLEFDEGIIEELEQWRNDSPEVIEDEVTHAHVADMTRLQQLALHTREEVYHGSGVVRVSAPPLERVDDDLLRRYYLAFGVHLGTPLGNYGRLYEVKDRGGDYTKTAIPVSQTKAATGLHTDSSAVDVLPDLVGLICIRPAPVGGASRIACALLAHQKLSQDHPELCRILEEPHYRDIVTPGADQSQRQRNRFPVFDVSDPSRGPVCRYMRFWIEKGYEKAEIEPHPQLQAALDRLDAILEEPDSVATFTLQRGEMLWVDNTTTLHDRTAYEDDPNAPRLLLRQWVVG